MGSPFTIILYSEDSAKAIHIAGQCFQLVDSLIYIFSDYVGNSELNRLCASAGTNTAFKCSPALFEILMRSKDAYEKSSGTFDITLGPLTKLWRKARKGKEFPDHTQIKEKLLLTGFNKILIDTVKYTATLPQKGMQLDLGGIAQGYIAQQAINFIKKQNIENALVDVSGDIVCIGMPPNTDGWTVAINVPESEDQFLPNHLNIANQAVTTSGDVYQYMVHNGKKYSHIINPSTGYGIISQRNVTVIAADGTIADWLTKACSILSINKAKRLVQSMNAAVLIVEVKNEKMFFHYSKNFEHFWKSQHPHENQF
ncbi:MAG: FAD:protein FMN transferase [Bacteroidetes bacterium]|nr:FAD:protein FMN transferase [Bacteroidota bacterium]